jgi:hypothetical protein
MEQPDAARIQGLAMCASISKPRSVFAITECGAAQSSGRQRPDALIIAAVCFNPHSLR